MNKSISLAADASRLAAIIDRLVQSRALSRPCALGEPAFVAAEGDRRRGPGCAALRAENWLHDLVLTDRALFWERPSEGVKNAPDGAMRGLQLWRTMAATFS